MEMAKVIAEIVVLTLVAILTGALLFGFPVMWLWNWLMPGIFGLPEISFWQAWGLLTLCGFLFKPASPAKDRPA